MEDNIFGAEGSELIEQEPVVREHLTQQELDACFDIRYHYKHVEDIFKRLGLD